MVDLRDAVETNTHEDGMGHKLAYTLLIFMVMVIVIIIIVILFSPVSFQVALFC
jgi:hypothetical protein